MPEKCKEIVYPSDRYGAFHPGQCSRRAVKDGYCKQHHPDSVAEHERKNTERFKQKQENSPYVLLSQARNRIKELEKEVKKLTEILSTEGL